MFKYQPTWLVAIFFTWSAVALPRFSYLSTSPYGLAEAILHIAYLFITLLVTNESKSYGYGVRYVLLGLLTGTIVALFYVNPSNIFLIYSVMLSSILAFYLNSRWQYGYIALIHTCFLLIHYYHWQNGWRLSDAGMFIAFHFFAAVVTQRMLSEQKAKEELALSHITLENTQALLTDAAADAERLSLARELHDDVGHQLTSLIINLDLARRTANASDKAQLEACYLQAKLALNTTREVVSKKRSIHQINLLETLHNLADKTPRLEVRLVISEPFSCTSLLIAQAILRCTQEALTNTLKHSNATLFQIDLMEDNKGYQLTLTDNGRGYQSFSAGNGLTGIQERIEQLNGQCDINQSANAFTITIRIPDVKN